MSAVNAAAAWEFGMGAGSETPAEGRIPLGGDYSCIQQGRGWLLMPLLAYACRAPRIAILRC